MITSLIAQAESGIPVVLCKNSPRMASKHARACEMARKAYLRAVYGYQPPKGEHWGWVKSAVADGCIVTVEVRLVCAHNTSLFELPLHVLKKKGISLKSTAAIEDLKDHVVKLTVLDRYTFNDITLSNVASVELGSKSNVITFT